MTMIGRKRIEGKAVARNFRHAAYGLGAILVLLAPVSSRAEDVKVFDKPPSLEEMRSALGMSGGAKPTMRTRSIQIDEGAEPAAAAAPAASPPPAYAAPAPAPAYTQPMGAPSQPAYAQPAPQPKQKKVASHSAPKQAEMAVSEKAIAMKINFDYNSAAIRPDSEGFINSLAQLLASAPQSQLVIEGHTDAAGAYGYNMNLSKGRAAAVRNALVQRYGVAPSRLIAVGKGPTEPLVPADPNSAENRRVQFRVRG
ncbi:MAG: OmpA family protein [Alphaproteobacteria bacterium]